MDKILKSKIERWQEFASAIKGMYKKLIEKHQKSEFDEEYYNLLSLLGDAKRIEKDIIEKLNINKTNYQAIKRAINCDEDLQIQILAEESDDTDKLRMSNILEEIALWNHDNFIENKPITSVFDIITSTKQNDDLANEQFKDKFINLVSINYIAMINKYLNEVQDKDIRDYLIFMLYTLISITPEYEEHFINFNCNILPTIDVIKDFPEIIGYCSIQVKELIYYNIKSQFLSDMMHLLCLNNQDMQELVNKKVAYRIVALNKARLISTKDEKFIRDLYYITPAKVPENPDYSIVIKLFEEMFNDALEIIKKDYYILKRNG